MSAQPSPPRYRVELELDYHDAAILVVALSDLKLTDDGRSAWEHPKVWRLRQKIADAIRDQVTGG